MAQDSARFLPIITEALNDIYAKMDDITKSIGSLGQNLSEFLTSIGQKNMLIIQSLKKLQNVINDFQNTDSLQKTIQLVNESINDIQDGIWFLEFQKALSRFKEKLETF
ncbi:MAG TPA: hypothetical protein VMV49_18075 [Candidatus Deferrimicrobium sp.]|nr:hypothetical protein [Candidatus Deferrimicrobium sp.]